MSLQEVSIFCPTPITERGKPSVLSVDPKGKLLVYASGSTVILRNVENPLQAKLYTQHTTNVTVAKISPSTYYCASGAVDGTVRIWATNNEDLTLKLETRPINGPVKDIAWSPDSQRVVVVGEGTERFALPFVFDTGATIGEIAGHSKVVTSVDFKPTRPFRVATGSEDMQVNFYEGPPFKFSKSCKDHTNYVNCVRFSPDGNFYVSVGSDKKVFLFDGKTGEKLGEIATDHTGSIYSCCWMNDSQRLLTTSADKTCKLWHIPEKRLLSTFQFADTSVDYMQVGCALAGEQLISLSLNGDLNYLDISNPAYPRTILHGHSKPISAVVYDVNTDEIITASSDSVILKWSHNGLAKRVNGKGHTSILTDIALVGGKLVSSGMDDQIVTSDLDSMKFLEERAQTKGGAIGCKAVPNSDIIIAATSQFIYVIRAGRILHQEAVDYNPLSLACSPNGQVAIGGKNKTIYVYQLDGDKLVLLGPVQGHQGPIYSISYNKSGTRLASGDSQRQLLLWNTESFPYTIASSSMIFHSNTIKSLDFSPNDKYLVSGSLDCNIIVWDLENESNKAVVRAHAGGVNGVCFMGYDKVVSVGQDASVRVWGVRL